MEKIDSVSWPVLKSNRLVPNVYDSTKFGSNPWIIQICIHISHKISQMSLTRRTIAPKTFTNIHPQLTEKFCLMSKNALSLHVEEMGKIHPVSSPDPLIHPVSSLDPLIHPISRSDRKCNQLILGQRSIIPQNLIQIRHPSNKQTFEQTNRKTDWQGYHITSRTSLVEVGNQQPLAETSNEYVYNTYCRLST